MSDYQKFVFNFNWKLTLSVVLFLPLLVSLSFWQLERAEEKKIIAERWQQLQNSAPVTFESVQAPEHEMRRVAINGTFLEDKYWLKENQFFNGELGYDVIMPFALKSGDIVAVNRGWVKGSPMRDFVPEIHTPAGEIRITGSLIVPSDSKLIREAETSAKTWPHKILEIDLPVLRKQSKLALHDKLLRIDADSPGAFIVNWRPINMSPAKHYGYAVQWALMAFALVVLFFFASTNVSQWLKQRF